VYSEVGHNFLRTMLRLHSERELISVVVDQVGTPTSAHSLAGALWAAATRPKLSGMYHWSDAGVCSWYDFAQAIGEEALALGVLAKTAQVRPIHSEDYPTPARRPSYSVLDKTRSWNDFELEPRNWRTELRDVLRKIKDQGNG
jgi:dTDP-4-dehydrorhamnose reductase